MSVQGPQRVLELAKVSRTFGEGATAVAALREVDLRISAGEFVAVMGPSGSGNPPSWRWPGDLTGRRRAVSLWSPRHWAGWD
ncbi:UNVERIFIED_ORG: ABC-type protease/lipase transport system fused ATPase/permease subunit [Arthrobacter sp. UYEF1]